MAVITYGEARLYPTPLYSLTSTINKTGDGTPISVNYDITLTGTLLPSRGNPSNAGVFPDEGAIADDTTAETTNDLSFKSLLLKQQALTDLFNEDGKKLEIYHDGGGAAKYTGYPEVVNISFSQGVTVDRTDYTITLRGIELVGNKLTYPESIASAIKANLESISESFSVNEQIDYDDDGAEIQVFSVSHTASGSARQSYNTDNNTLPGPNGAEEEDPSIRAYENVRTVLKGIVKNDALSDSTNLAAFLLNSTSNVNVANYRITDDFLTENGDYYDGSYTITRTLSLRPFTDGDTYVATHEYTVSTQMNTPNIGSNKNTGASLGYVNNFSISGTIQGIPATIGASRKTAYFSADLAFAALINDKDYAKVINLINAGTSAANNLSTSVSSPVSSSVSTNKRKGSITYSFSFIEKPADGNPIAAKFFLDYDVNVNEKHDDQKIAVIPILGRSHGPIIQNLNTTNLYTRTISGTFVLKNRGATLEGGQPYQWDDINTIRQNAINVIESEPASSIEGTQGTDWFVTDWNDGLDVFKGVYNINLTLSVVRDADTKDVDSSGWLTF